MIIVNDDDGSVQITRQKRQFGYNGFGLERFISFFVQLNKRSPLLGHKTMDKVQH